MMAFNPLPNYRGNPNDVHNSNDTPITLALEKGDFLTAERLIISENTEVHTLDDGPFKMIPLTFVLSIDSRPWHLQVYKQHLGLAKLLVEKGANPNIRIPSSDWRGASRSPIELLVDMILYSNESISNPSAVFTSTIGLNNEELTANNRREQLMELLDTFLVCGANPNVTTNGSNATVYHLVMLQADPDIELIMKLSNFGGDLHQTNIHGTTALMDLIKSAEGDLSLDILNEIWHNQPDCEISSLLAQNCKNQTAIWHAVFAGSIQLAIKLLKQGADSSIAASVNRLRSNGTRPKLAPIFSPLLQDSYAYRTYTTINSMVNPRSISQLNDRTKVADVTLMNKVIANSITPIVDSTIGCKCFPDDVLLGLEKLVTVMTRFKTADILSPAVNTRDVPYLMFGNLKAGLQQKCVRTVMEQILTKDSNISQPRFVEKLDAYRVANIVTNDLALPVCLVPMFNIEAARIQLGFALYRGTSMFFCENGCVRITDDEDDYDLDDDNDELDSYESSGNDDSFYGNWMEMDDNQEEVPEVVINEDDAKADEDDGWETMSNESDDSWGAPFYGWGQTESIDSSDNERRSDQIDSDFELSWD